MPVFNITMGEAVTGRPVHRLRPITAETRGEAERRAPRIPGLVIVACESDAPAPDAKRCGCPPGGLTRAVTLWECAGCGHVQGARRRRCEGCGERKRPATSQPHQDHTSFSPNVERGEYVNRRGQRVCVGCQKAIPTP